MNKEELNRVEELQSKKIKFLSEEDVALWLRRYSEIWSEIIFKQRTKVMIQIVDKIWGYEEIIANNDYYCLKFLHLKEGFQCSYHYHKLKHETFYLLKGCVDMIIDGNYLRVRKGDAITIPQGMWHSFAGYEDSILVEVSTHHFDDDSYRDPNRPGGKVE